MDLVPVAPTDIVPVAASVGEWLAASVADPIALQQMQANAETHAATKKFRHAANTVRNYDTWWERFDRWCRMPSYRVRGRALPAATPALAFDPDDPRGLQILVIFLYELVYGPEDPDARQIWEEDFGPLAPSTLAVVMSALKARCSDHLGHELHLTGELKDALRGLHRIARNAYGKDRRATPLLAEHLRTMLRYLAGADDPLIARDRLLLELAAVGVTPAEVARLTVEGLLIPDGTVLATTHESNVRLWEHTGQVGIRALLIPGRSLGAGRRAVNRIVTLADGHSLTAAVDSWIPHRLDPEDPALIDGVGPSNPRSIHRTALKALAVDAATEGCDWQPGRDNPIPKAADLAACRRTLARRAAADLALRQRDTAALWIGWRLALRRSELMALTVGDVEMFGDRALITIVRSKTDQDGKGVTLPVVAGSRTDGLNPLEDFAAWLQTLAELHGLSDRSSLPPDTPLFPALNRGQEILCRQIKLDDGTVEMRRYDQLSSQGWSDRLRVLAERSGAITDAGLLANVTGHSLRRGYITSAARAGRTAVQIRRVSRHVDLNSLARYVDEVQHQWDDNPDDFELLVPDVTSSATRAAPVTLDVRLGASRF